MEKAARYRIIIAGGRDFNDYELLKYQVKKFILENCEINDIEIVSGMARGADLLGIDFATEYWFPVAEFPANWEKYDKRAGIIRNEEMAKYANMCICFWDGKSRGTKNMIENAERYKLKLKVINY